MSNTILTILTTIITSGLVSGLVSHFSNKNLDVYKRTMETRKEVYTKVNELLSAFYSTASPEETNQAFSEILRYFREIQIWGSDEVVRKFQEFLYAIDIKNNISQENRDLIYKNLVISMRKDILKDTNLIPEEIAVHGHINSKK